MEPVLRFGPNDQLSPAALRASGFVVTTPSRSPEYHNVALSDGEFSTDMSQLAEVLNRVRGVVGGKIDAELDLGCDGDEGGTTSCLLSTRVLELICEMGLELRVTFYPF